MDHASDNMNSMAVIHSPTCTNDSFLATLEHSLKVVRFMPVVIVNSTPTEKSVATEVAGVDAKGNKVWVPAGKEQSFVDAGGKVLSENALAEEQADARFEKFRQGGAGGCRGCLRRPAESGPAK
jgi:hypothetical protein